MKQIQPLPLKERVRRVKDGQSAYPEYTLSVIRTLAELPLADYLARFQEAQAQLCALLSLPDCEELTYQEAARRIRQLHRKDPKAAGKAACILALPMKYYFESRTERSGT